jgi:hypothetical protein
MKHLLCTLALLFAAGAQAQVYFGPGSTKPINPEAATADVPRDVRAQPAVKVRQKLVRCRDGAKRTPRACRRHGGVARR